MVSYNKTGVPVLGSPYLCSGMHGMKSRLIRHLCSRVEHRIGFALDPTQCSSIGITGDN